MTSFSDVIISFPNKGNFKKVVNFHGVLCFLCTRHQHNWWNKVSSENRLPKMNNYSDDASSTANEGNY